MMNSKQIIVWVMRFSLLLMLFYIFFISGTLAISGLLPDFSSEPGLLSNDIGFLIIGISNTLLVMALILNSRWYGWKLVLRLSFAYYGAVTFLTQIETWYFLSDITVDEKLLFRLFIMGLPVAFIYIPLAVWILGKRRSVDENQHHSAILMPVKQWVWKIVAISLVYLVLYWSAGYFIAWQNPNLRAFYGSPGDIIPFWKHTVNTLSENPGLFPFQILRGMLWAICSLPIIYGAKTNVYWTAILLGLFLIIPQCLGLLLENPLMPNPSVRLSHLVEGVSSNFIFALVITWLLHRKHESIPNLFGSDQVIRENSYLTEQH